MTRRGDSRLHYAKAPRNIEICCNVSPPPASTKLPLTLLLLFYYSKILEVWNQKTSLFDATRPGSRPSARNHGCGSSAFSSLPIPRGLVVGEILNETGIPPSTLSHHLEKLKNHGLVTVEREATYLRYRADTDGLRDLLTFLFAECCTRNKAIEPSSVVQLKEPEPPPTTKRRTK